MKKLIISAAVLAATATGALAQTATQDVNLSAQVNGFCTIGTSNTGAVLTGTVSPTTNGQVGAGSVTLSGAPGTVVCNTNAAIGIQSLSNGLTGPGSPSGDFINKIHYTATAAIGSASAAITTTGTVTGPTSGTAATTTTGAFSAGSLDIAINTIATASNQYLLPGTYTDTLRITLTPQ